MTQPDALEHELTATLQAAAQRVPYDVTARLASGLVDVTPPKHRRASVLLLIAAVALIAIVPTVLVATRTSHRETSAAVASPSPDPAPEGLLTLSGQTWDGHDISTRDYLGAPLLVVIWGSWCGPCASEVAAIGTLGTRTGVEVLGVDARESSRQVAGQAEKDLGVDYPSIWDASGDIAASAPDTAEVYPSTLLLDSQGQVIGTWAGATGPTELADIEAKVTRAQQANSGPPLLDEDARLVAAEIAREQTRRLQGVDVTATATVERGIVRQSNTGHPCTSGHVIQIQLAGRFDAVDHGGVYGQPYLPTTGVNITADFATGEPCKLSVSTGTQTPSPGSVVVYQD